MLYQCYLCDFTDYNEEISNHLIFDEERKYGKIPTEVYRLYLKSCGPRVVAIFCITVFGWQAMKIYTDVWLRYWTDIDYGQRFTDVSNGKMVVEVNDVLIMPEISAWCSSIELVMLI